jgi:hypothetical protein
MVYTGAIDSNLIMRKLFFIIAILFFPAFALAQTAPEESGLRLVTSPLPISLSTSPGNTITTDLKIKNDGLKTERLKIDLMKFRAYEESGKPALEEVTSEDTFIQWVSLSEKEFEVAPGEWKTVQATFTPPDGAAFGYYYTFVFTRAAQAQAVAGQAAIHGGSAVLVLLDVAVPGAKRSIVLDTLATSKKVYEFLPVDFLVKLHNNGNVHAAPRGNIFIKNSAGKEVALLEVNFEKGNILPSSKRIFETRFQEGFPVYEERVIDNALVRDEEGNIMSDLKWNFTELDNLRVGRYTANLVMAYDDGQRDIPIEGEVSFWVIPWRILGGILLVTLIICFGLFSMFRSAVRTVRSGKSKR